ncbi:hypothetical protein ACE1TI_21745 [Alteribacillus sp. JSM 102045]|uniref:hypothetical protein n=1 Tax=Alteribacillus sp. JSM 102045 TaxID=1562101 RepID=UPI0035BFCFF5
MNRDSILGDFENDEEGTVGKNSLRRFQLICKNDENIAQPIRRVLRKFAEVLEKCDAIGQSDKKESIAQEIENFIDYKKDI